MNSPLSRIGSTARLNQSSTMLGSPQQGAQSPSTNTPYLMNTVTSTTGTTPNLGLNHQLHQSQLGSYAYSNDLKIFQEIDHLESLVLGISKSIGSYKSPELDTVKELVSTVTSMDSIISQIKNSTKLQREQSLKLNQANIELNNLFKEILLELKSYRKTLSDLPSLESSSRQENHKVTTEMLLEYALKLSKFSKIPRMIETNITASNFVWPGEDSLRRGVLAMVSNDPSKFIDFDILEKQEELQEITKEDLMEVDNDSEDDDLKDFEDVDVPVQKKQNVDAVEGLDLFDSDEDD